MSSVCAVVVAGGCGARFGNPGGKQLVNVAGKPLMTWSIRAFDRSAFVSHIVVVCPAEKMDEMRRQAIDPYNFATPITFAEAGKTRQDSAARPLITAEVIDRAICSLRCESGVDGVVCGQAAIDTLKVVDGNRIVETPPRSRYWAAQTPQIFALETMRRAHAAALADGFVGTDDSSLVERMGGRVLCVDSPRDNLKVTVPEDLRPVTAILLGRMSDADAMQNTGILTPLP